MKKNWTKEGYKLYAMKDGYIMNFSMGSFESIEDEIMAKGTRRYDFWLVEKDGKIDFYSVKIDPMAQGLGMEIKKEKTISGIIAEDKRSNYQGFGAFGGGIVVDFMNYRIVEKTAETKKMKKLDIDRVNPCGHIEEVDDLNKEWHRDCSNFIEDLCDMAEEYPCEINGELWTSSIGFKIVYAYINLDNEDWSEFHFYNGIDDDNWIGRKNINGNEIEQLTWGQLSDDVQNRLMEHYYDVVFPALFDRFYSAYYEHTLYNL